MHYTAELLLTGDTAVVGYYRAARRIWEELLANEEAKDVATLASRLGSVQSRFERECGGRWVGQEVMAVSGIAQFYTTAEGFGDRLKDARRVYDALRASYCSMEVKFHADAVAASYHLMEEADE